MPGMRGSAMSGATDTTHGSGASTTSTTSSSVRSTVTEPEPASIIVAPLTEGSPRRAASCTSTCCA